MSIGVFATAAVSNFVFVFITVDDIVVVVVGGVVLS